MKARARTCGCHSHNGLLLSLEGLAQRELKLDGVDDVDASLYLDKVGSVSALRRDEIIFDDALLEQQHRRFLHD